MTPGFTTWAEIGTIQGNLLVVINSADGALDTVGRLFEAVEAHLAGTMYVVAPLGWGEWLSTKGLTHRTLFSADNQGRALEINHFLESPEALMWQSSTGFQTIVGTDPHSMYNEEVKQPFEQRACLLIGAGCFLAHSLPSPYVFIFDMAWLLERCGRAQKVSRYQRVSRAMINDLHNLWIERGRPSGEDDSDVGGVADVMSRAMTPAVLAFDEDAADRSGDEDLRNAVVGVVSHWVTLMVALTHRYAERLQAVSAEREALLREWEATQQHATELHRERVEAVNLRDQIIEDLRHRPLYRRLIRWLREARR
jgi:hypothetical protein